MTNGKLGWSFLLSSYNQLMNNGAYKSLHSLWHAIHSDCHSNNNNNNNNNNTLKKEKRKRIHQKLFIVSNCVWIARPNCCNSSLRGVEAFTASPLTRHLFQRESRINAFNCFDASWKKINSSCCDTFLWASKSSAFVAQTRHIKLNNCHEFQLGSAGIIFWPGCRDSIPLWIPLAEFERVELHESTRFLILLELGYRWRTRSGSIVNNSAQFHGWIQTRDEEHER